MQRARRPGAIRRLSAKLAACAVALAVAGAHTPASAEDRIPALARMMRSSSDKTRLSAVLALAKLSDRAAQPPLIAALRDANAKVRVVAATALGRLATTAALPTLRALASDDADDDVRKAAGNAALKIARAGRGAEARVARVDADPSAHRTASASRPAPGAADAARPQIYLLVSSAADDSPGAADKATRRTHAELVKRVLLEACKAEPAVTSVAADAQRWGLAARHVDLSVTRLDAVRSGPYMEIGAELRIAISDDSGKMMSFLTGGAKVQIPAAKYDARYLTSLRREALEDATRAMFGKLLAHLREPGT